MSVELKLSRREVDSCAFVRVLNTTVIISKKPVGYPFASTTNDTDGLHRVKCGRGDTKGNIMAYGLTEKSKNLIQTKMIDGELYALCDKDGDRELWLLVTPPPEIKCVVCGYNGVAIDKHHVHGRKNSDVTVYLCSNCHREYHQGAMSEEDVKKIFEGAR